jgi:hypothetical protein
MMRRISDLPYLSFGTAMCLLAFASLIWFSSSELGVADPEWVGENFSGVLPRISAPNGWRGATAALANGLLCLFGFNRRGDAPQPIPNRA